MVGDVAARMTSLRQLRLACDNSGRQYATRCPGIPVSPSDEGGAPQSEGPNVAMENGPHLIRYSREVRESAHRHPAARPVAGTHIRGFTSGIDGSVQHYVVHIPEGAGDVPLPLIAIVPYMRIPPRPFLESPELALFGALGKAMPGWGIALGCIFLQTGGRAGMGRPSHG